MNQKGDHHLEVEHPEKFYQPSISTLGNWPRNFKLTESLIIIANQRSNNLVVYDKKSNKEITKLDIQLPVYIELIK